MAARTSGLRESLRRLARPRRREALPVALDRGRIYVLPTRFGLVYAALVTTMLVGALNYNNNPALLLALLLAGVGLASVFAGHRQLSGLRVLALEATPVPAGAQLRAHLHAAADPRQARQGLRLAAMGTDASALLHLRDGRGMAELPLPTRHRGLLPPPRLRLSSTRPLGLALNWAWLLPEQPLLVYPAAETDGPPLPSGSGRHSDSRPRRDGEDMHHLRDYRSGDARHAIAWKPSARHASLLVREHEQPQGGELDLDWNLLHGLDSEARIRRLARWVDEAEREERRYRLRLPGQPPIGPARGPQHRHACLRALALLPGGPQHDAAA